MHLDTLAIVGVGLIGGSVGLAARRRGVARRVVGADPRPEHLERARARGALDEGLADAAAAVSRAEVSVFCTPVDQIVDQVLVAAPGCAAGTLLTDAGSTKAAIVRGVEGRLPPGVAFVGGHPLAGSEKHGPAHADPDLFLDRLVILTPTPQTYPSAVERTAALWRALGARVRTMGPEEHDRALALTSHLPHVVASALAGVLPPQLHDLTATGFRDTTRLASGSPELWAAILGQNRAAVLDTLERFGGQLARFREALESGDESRLRELFASAKAVRDALTDAVGQSP